MGDSISSISNLFVYVLRLPQTAKTSIQIKYSLPVC